ncbi:MULTISPECIES: nucleotidyltransferase domain-containing protein [Archaeoglobus]|uniref:Polymerase nucleotidyl transferase domain-containing protein n=1 Tax=Archaeoglobus fulgidus TaxID=2234 RepID=A0A117KUP4_ARCFL|nr:MULTISPECIES: nucleotidyltransferase domain-containing protein [Archaeoglobus]KUJ94687.1 MAG: hypothetical protein XD40_0008 [Archaeoglobus fulgidus]KUK06940.1 MAG: hypothetical protein XD48_0802 [Archaeoglobus fulgidus]MDI3496999.1 uncharacterized protein [Archaeoglobus sp.]
MQKELINEIIGEVKPKAIALFGSQAKGKAGKFSDYDLLIITKDEESRNKAEKFEKGKVEIHALTMRTALELIHKGDPFFTQIIKECKPIYGEFYIKFLREVAENVGKSKVVA